MRKHDRKRLRRWYFQRWCYQAVYRYFRKEEEAHKLYYIQKPPEGVALMDYIVAHWMQAIRVGIAYQEAQAWAMGFRQDIRLAFPRKGKVSQKTIRVIRIDLTH